VTERHIYFSTQQFQQQAREIDVLGIATLNIENKPAFKIF
jgi:hypothetical protein